MLLRIVIIMQAQVDYIPLMFMSILKRTELKKYRVDFIIIHLN